MRIITFIVLVISSIPIMGFGQDVFVKLGGGLSGNSVKETILLGFGTEYGNKFRVGPDIQFKSSSFGDVRINYVTAKASFRLATDNLSFGVGPYIGVRITRSELLPEIPILNSTKFFQFPGGDFGIYGAIRAGRKIGVEIFFEKGFVTVFPNSTNLTVGILICIKAKQNAKST